jgi:hypothetical protein
VGAPDDLLKAQRARVLTASDPTLVLRLLAEAFDAFGALPQNGASAGKPIALSAI